jgi:hypothetical protein
MDLNAVLQVGMGESASFWPDVAEQPDRRESGRRTLTLKTVTNSPSDKELPVTIRDISPQGFLIEAESEALSEGDQINISLPDIGLVIARVVWASERHFGCHLDKAISPGAIAAALLRADARVFQDDAQLATAGPRMSHRSAHGRFEPELNFSVAFYLAILLWAIIGLALYFALS